MFLAAGVLGLALKNWLWVNTLDSRTHHAPEEQARRRIMSAESLWRYVISLGFWILPMIVHSGVLFFCLGVVCTMASLGSQGVPSGSLDYDVKSSSLVSIGLSISIVLYLLPGYSFFASSFLVRDLGRRLQRLERIILARQLNKAPDSEIILMEISNFLFTHTSMVPKNFSIFIPLFSLPVENPRLRIESLAPWIELSSLLPSMLMELYSQSRYNLLPALRLCLVVSGQGQPEQLRVNREAKRVYSTIKTSGLLQNLYLHLLLSRLHADTDRWQEACRILKCLEYSEEHTSELVWLVDSIQLYTLWIKDDFTSRIVEFLRGVVVYLVKCPSDEQNAGLLRTATIMAVEWLMSRQSSDSGSPPLQYILSSQNVHFGEENRKASQNVFFDKKNGGAFVPVKNKTLSLDDRRQLSIDLSRDSHETGSSSDFVIRTLLVPIIAIEGFAVENIRGSIQSGDLWRSLESLWDLWEGGFNRSNLLRFVLRLVVPPSPPVGDTQSSMVTLLLMECLRQINESSALITEKAFRFIDGALVHSLTTGTTRDELRLQLQDVQWTNPWLALHIDNILRRRSTPSAADLEGMTTLDSRVKSIVIRKRFNLYLSSNVQPEPDILALLVQSDDLTISLEAFGQGVNLLEPPLIGESDGQSPESPRAFTFAQIEQETRSDLLSRFFDHQQSTSTCQSVWIMLTEDLYPRWELLPADWRSDIAAALVEAMRWMKKGQEIFSKEIEKRKAKQLIGATVLALVNYSDMEHHRKRKIPLETRDERFQERLDACAQVYLRLFATAIEDLGERAKPHTQRIVNFLVDIPDVLYNEDAIKRIQHVLGI